MRGPTTRTGTDGTIGKIDTIAGFPAGAWTAIRRAEPSSSAAVRPARSFIVETKPAAVWAKFAGHADAKGRNSHSFHPRNKPSVKLDKIHGHRWRMGGAHQGRRSCQNGSRWIGGSFENRRNKPNAAR